MFLAISPVSPWAKRGGGSFLMTSPLMNIWCRVLAHIWKEANSQHKYLMWTLYILTSHISINYKTNMWTHNKTALLATVESLFPHYLSSCYRKAATWALVWLHFLLIDLWGAPSASHPCWPQPWADCFAPCFPLVWQKYSHSGIELKCRYLR